MSQGQPGLSPYEVAYLAGGPARVAQTATAELLRTRQLTALPTGQLVLAEPAALPERWPASGAARDLEQQILVLASAPAGLYLRRMQRRCAGWQPVLQIGSGLAAAGLALRRRSRRLALAAALVLLAAGAAAGAAIAGGWQAAPTARSPLAAVGAVMAAGLLLRARQRTTGDGRAVLADTAQLTRQMLAYLPPVTAPEIAPAPPAAAGSPALTPADVASVALTGLQAVRDPDLRAWLRGPAPRGRRSPAEPAAAVRL